jgi:hypothetical protein
MFLPKRSITTIHLAGFTDCADVLAAGHKLTSDINGDCHVDYLDLDAIAEYWLYSVSSDCGGIELCQDSDLQPDNYIDFIDFGILGLQWTQCNDPEDPECSPNW